MANKPHVRSYCNPAPRLVEATQRALLTGEIYPAKERAELIQSIRHGDLIEVVELYLLAKAAGRSDARKRDLLKTVDEIEERGGIILEQSTGRRSDKPKDWRYMQAQAFEQLASSGRARKSARNGALSKGAPPLILEPEEHRICEQEWFSRKHGSDDERIAAIKAKLGKRAPGRSWLRKTFGSPHGGRKAANKA